MTSRAPKGIDWDSVPDLGVSADCAIAKRLGCATNSVRSARATRGISKRTASKPAAPIVPVSPVKPMVMTDDVREFGVMAALVDLPADVRARVLAYANARWPSLPTPSSPAEAA
jgi:hypothetical protein